MAQAGWEGGGVFFYVHTVKSFIFTQRTAGCVGRGRGYCILDRLGQNGYKMIIILFDISLVLFLGVFHVPEKLNRTKYKAELRSWTTFGPQKCVSSNGVVGLTRLCD